MTHGGFFIKAVSFDPRLLVSERESRIVRTDNLPVEMAPRTNVFQQVRGDR